MSEIESSFANGPGQAPKQDPESLALRGPARPVIRVRKSLIVGLTAAASASLIALAWLSLKPPSFSIATSADPGEPIARSSLDAIAGVPAAYSDVPRLGPPLPGDLGRPILERRRELGIMSERDASDSSDLNAAAERRGRADEERSARSSPIIVQLVRTGPAVEADAPHKPAAAAPANETASAAPDSSQLHKQDFAGPTGAGTNEHVAPPAASQWTLAAGTVIPASLVTGLNSDLPGTVIAQVTENVRDSATGRTLLVPQGSRLVGRYDSAVAFGQKRALLVWRRLVFPDGSAVALDNMPATDASGHAGLEDRVDFHEWRLIKGIALSTLLGVGAALGTGSGGMDIADAIRESAAQNGARAGEQMVSRNLAVQPTLTVRPGWPVRLLVNEDLILKPWKG